MSDLLVGEGYGRAVGFRGNSAALERLQSLLPFWWQPSDEQPVVVFDVADGVALAGVVRDVEQWIAEHADGWVFVHSAAVAIDGQAILLPGRTYTGKTTLCAALLDQGANYLSDEYAVLDTQGRAYPYPRALHLRADGLTVAATPAAYGALTAEPGLPVAMIVSTAYSDFGFWNPVQMSPGAAALTLLDNTVCAQTRKEDAAAAVALASNGAVALQGVRGSAALTAEPLIAMMRARFTALREDDGN